MSRKSSCVREMKRNRRGPGPEGFELCSSVSEIVSKIDRWMNMARKRDIETDRDSNYEREIKIEIELLTLDLRDKALHHYNDLGLVLNFFLHNLSPLHKPY